MRIRTTLFAAPAIALTLDTSSKIAGEPNKGNPRTTVFTATSKCYHKLLQHSFCNGELGASQNVNMRCADNPEERLSNINLALRSHLMG